MSVSIDGFIAGANEELDWTTGPDEAAEQWTLESVCGASVHLMGSHTYYDMASYWPKSRHAFAAPMNQIPKAVFSRKGRLERPPAEPTRNAAELPPEPVEQPGGAHVLESWMSARVLSDLVDEYQLLVHPVAIGTGMALFSPIAPPLRLDLVYARSFPGGTVAHVYRPRRRAS